MNDNTYATIYDLLYSVTVATNEETQNFVINQLKDTTELDVDEKKVLNTFISLKDEIKSIPSSGTLVSRDMAFSSAKTINESSLEDLTKIFISNKTKMKLTSELTNIAMDIAKPGSNIKEAQEKLLKIINSTKDTEETNKINTYDIENKLEELHNKPEVHGIPFGIDFIDDQYPGTTPGSFTIIGGYTGSMKTTLAVNHIFIGMLQGYNSVYFSLEVSEEDLIYNLMSLYTITCTSEPIKRDDIKKLKFKDKEKFNKIFTDLMSLPGKINIYDESMIESYSQTAFNSIIHKVDEEFKEKTSRGLDIIVLDHAQLLKYDSDSKNNIDPYKVLNSWTDYFRKFASRDNKAVILVSQTSRGGYEYATKHGGQYLLTGLAEANELERGATCVITVYSNDELKSSGQLSVQILKSRYSPPMLEPITTDIKPEYYLVGSGYNTKAKQVDAVFTDEDTPTNIFDNEPIEDLDSLLGGM